MRETCYACHAGLTADEKAVYRKLVNRGAETFLCIGCLSRRLGVSQELIREKIAAFRAAGCRLFR